MIQLRMNFKSKCIYCVCIATSPTSFEYSVKCVFVNSHTNNCNSKYVMCSGVAKILELCPSTIGIDIGLYIQVNSRKNYLAKQTNSKSNYHISYDHIGKYMCFIATSPCVCLNIQC